MIDGSIPGMYYEKVYSKYIDGYLNLFQKKLFSFDDSSIRRRNEETVMRK